MKLQVYVSLYVCTNVCVMYVYVYVSMYICIKYTRIYVCRFYVCMYDCVCIYVITKLCIYECM